MSFWNSLRISSSALNAQRLRLDLIANNVANAETTRTASGTPYQRQDVVFSANPGTSFLPLLIRARQDPTANVQLGGVRAAEIVTDNTPGSRVYDPTHPDADEGGFVTYPNVNLVVEMTNMLSATRSYEANLSTMASARRMALRALEIGK